jgi:hypothetical protein
LSSSHAPSRGSSWTTSSVNFGRRRVERQLGRGVQRPAAAHVHLQPVRAERRDVLEQHDPLGPSRAARSSRCARQRLALLARDLAVAMAERGVAHRLEVHQRQHRRRGARDDLRARVAPLVPGRDEVVLGAHVAQLLGDRAHDADVLLVERRR